MLPIRKILIEGFKEWIRDRGTAMSAALAYTQFLSVAPFIGFILIASNRILGESQTLKNVVPVLKNWFTPQFIIVIKFLLEPFAEKANKDFINISIIAGLILFFSAKEYFDQLRDTIDTTFNLRREEFGFMAFLKRVGEALTIGAVLLLIAILYLVLRSLLPLPFIDEGYERHNILVDSVQVFIQFATMSLFIFYLFAIAPPVKVYWKNAIPGTLLGGLLFVIGRQIMRYHMYQNLEADVGESLILVLLWFYYSNLTFTYAAEFNKVYIADRQGINIEKLRF